MNITYMGKPLEPQKRTSNGRYTSLKSGLKRFIRALVRLTVIAVVFVGAAAYIGAQYFSDTVVATNEVSIDRTHEKIEGLKDDVVARLLQCESAGYKEDDAIIMYDNNQAGSLKGKNVWSLGQLQFKVPTIIEYVQKRDGVKLTHKEAVLLALDTEKAKELASWIIFNTDGGIWNWKNCADKLGLAEEVTVIKKLSK